jgi:hypothetical protein
LAAQICLIFFLLQDEKVKLAEPTIAESGSF